MSSYPSSILNINIGVLGHVDSGKTSLVKSISSILSTASLDKSAQSRERGITLDLGFSAYCRSIPSSMHFDNYRELQYTFVDCPGHSSLIRTMIGGSNIIDCMFLVIDITKGLQTQTSECIILAEILKIEMIVILNKIDLLEESGGVEKIENIKKKLLIPFSKTSFKNIKMVAVSATTNNIAELTSYLADFNNPFLKNLNRSINKPLLILIDHCFPIKGHGSICTGTLLSGKLNVGDTIEIISGLEKTEKKVKSIQCFHKNVNTCYAGDRAAFAITQFDAKSIERGWACSINSMVVMKACIAKVKRIKFYKDEINTGSLFHISIGHSTVLASAHFFSLPSNSNELDFDSLSLNDFNFNVDYTNLDSLAADIKMQCYVFLEFEHPLYISPNCGFIASKLDAQVGNSCRLAFNGDILQLLDPKDKIKLKLVKPKQKEGSIDRITDNNNLIGNYLFSKEVDLNTFIGLKLELTCNETIFAIGVIDGGFGKNGKFRVYFKNSLPDEVINADATKLKTMKLILKYKKYAFNDLHGKNKFIQD